MRARAAPSAGEALGQGRGAQEVVEPRARRLIGGSRLELELIRPRQERAPKELIHHDDHQRHGDHREDDRAHVLLAHGLGNVGADAWQGVVVVQHSDRFAGADEEPAAAKAHHRVPQQADHAVGHGDLPKTLPKREAVNARGFVQVARQAAHRVVKREGHVPHLPGEDGEDRRGLQPEQAAREERDEERHRRGEEAEHGHGLQHIERGDDHALGVGVARRHPPHDEGEDEREEQRDEHAQRGAQQVVGQVDRVEADARQHRWRLKGDEHPLPHPHHERDQRQHAEQQRHIGEGEGQSAQRLAAGEGLRTHQG